MVKRMQTGAMQAAAIAALVLLLAPLPASAEGYAHRSSGCWNGSSFGCAAARNSYDGTHAYERWQDNTPAMGSGSPPASYQFPQYLGGHSAWYGLGR